MKLGEKIWRLRESQHLSQEELAEKLEVTRQTVSNWENEKAVPDVEKLAKLCAVFGVSADDMLYSDELPQPVARSRYVVPVKKWNKGLAVIVFAIVALVFIVIATVGLIVSDDKVSISSLITFHSDFVWIALFVLGGVALICAIVAIVKKK